MEPEVNEARTTLMIPLDSEGNSKFSVNFGEIAFNEEGYYYYSDWAKFDKALPCSENTNVFDATFSNQTWFGMIFRNDKTNKIKLNLKLDSGEKTILNFEEGQRHDLWTLEKQFIGPIDSSRYFVYLDPLETFETFNFGHWAYQPVSWLKLELFIEDNEEPLLPPILIRFRSQHPNYESEIETQSF